MPQGELYQIYQIEEEFEANTETLLELWFPSGFSANVYQHEEGTVIETPSIQVHFGCQGEHTERPRAKWKAATGATVSLPQAFNISAEFTIKAQRKNTGESGQTYMRTMRGIVRAMMASYDSTNLGWNSKLTYGQVHDCIQGATTYAVDAGENLDVCTMNFDLVYILNASSFPTISNFILSN